MSSDSVSLPPEKSVFKRIVVYTNTYYVSDWHGDQSTDDFCVELLLEELLAKASAQHAHVDGERPNVSLRWGRSLNMSENVMIANMHYGPEYYESSFNVYGREALYQFIDAWIQEEEGYSVEELTTDHALEDLLPEAYEQHCLIEGENSDYLLEMAEAYPVTEGSTTIRGIPDTTKRKFGLTDIEMLDQRDANRAVAEVYAQPRDTSQKLPTTQEREIKNKVEALVRQNHSLQPGVYHKATAASPAFLRSLWILDDVPVHPEIPGRPELSVGEGAKILCNHVGRRSRKRCALRKGHRSPHRYI